MRLPLILTLCLAGALALSACGRRGGLEPPPAAIANKPAQTSPAPEAGLPPRAFENKNVPEQPFILDGLI